MKRNPIKILMGVCLAGLLLTAITAQAQQTYPIYVMPSLTPPYSLSLSDYAQPGGQRLVTTIIVNDISITNLPVRLHLKIETVTGVIIESRADINARPIYLNGGEVNILFGDDLAEYFNINNLQFNGYSKDEYRRNGQLPEGFYRFTIEVRHFTTGRLISNRGTATAWMALGKPPVLKTPDNKAQLGQIAGIPLTFSWVPSSVGVPSGGAQYTFELWEMRVPGIPPEVIVASMPVVYSTTQMTTSLVVHPAELMLEPGMTYAWRVTVSDITGQVQYAQKGHSEVRTFTYQCGCDEVTGLSAMLEGSNAVFRWNSTQNHTAFNIEIENPTTNWSKKDRVYDTKVTLPNPEAGTTYRLRVQGICGGYNTTGDFSSWQSITIPKKQIPEDNCPDCACSNAGAEPNVSNLTLKKDLRPDDIIQTASGSSRFIIKSATQQGDGTYKGQFLFWIELWKVKVLCNYQHLKVNTDNVIIDMDFESVYDPKLLADLDAAQDYFNELKDAVDVLADAIKDLLNNYTGSEKDREKAKELQKETQETVQNILNDPNVSKEDKDRVRDVSEKAQPAWEALKNGTTEYDCSGSSTPSQEDDRKSGPNPSNGMAGGCNAKEAVRKEAETLKEVSEKTEQEKTESTKKDFEIQLFNGTTRSGKDSVMLITAEPKMPAIKIKPVGTTDKEVEFCLQITYQRDGVSTKNVVIHNVRNDVSSYPSNGWKKVKMNEEWTVDFGQDFRGGTAYLMCRDSNKTDTIRFYIRGSNPTETQIKDYMSQKSYLSQYWFIVKMTRQESSMLQFGNTSNYRTAKLTGITQGKGEPYYGPPKGFGLKQLDNWGTAANPKNATEQHLWNWKENIDGGVEVIREKKAFVDGAKAINDGIISDWNNEYLNNQISDSLYIDKGEGAGTTVLTITEGNVTFSVNPTGVQKDVYDARWIKLFNGGGLYYQITGGGSIKPKRVVNRSDGSGNNYVSSVCSKSD